MSGGGIAEQDRDIGQWLAEGSASRQLGWVIHDGLLDSVPLWIEQLERHGQLRLLGRINPGSPGRLPGRDLQPLLAELRAPISPWPTDPGQALDQLLAHLRTLCRRYRSTPVLVVQHPSRADEQTQRALGILARQGVLKLLFHLVPGAALPPRFQRLADAGQLIRCRADSMDAPRLARQVQALTGQRMPTLQAVAWHRAIGGEERAARLLLDALEDPAARELALSGRLELLPPLPAIENLLRLRRAQLSPALRELMDLCAVAGHLPTATARQLTGGMAVDECLAARLLRQGTCGAQPVLEFSAALLGGYWCELLSAYELLRLGERLAAVADRCAHAMPNLLLASLERGENLSTGLVAAALQEGCEQGLCRQAERLAVALRQRLARERDRGVHQQALVALARYVAQLEGPHQALRMLNVDIGDRHGAWGEQPVRALAIQLFLETGRLFPTVQRAALAAGLPVPHHVSGPEFWDLLPADRVLRHLQSGLRHAAAHDLRRALVHFAAGLRECLKHPNRPNSVTLRVSLLNNTVLTMGMGGYRRQFEALGRYLHRHPEPWLRRSAAAWHLAEGVLQMQDGEFATGRASIGEAAELARRLGLATLQRSAAGLATWLDAHSVVHEAGDVMSSPPLIDKAARERAALEDAANAALMRDPQALRTVIEQSRSLRDPRGMALHIAARAELGELEPLHVIHRLVAMNQRFLAAWLVDGLLLRRMLPHAGEIALPTSRAIEQLADFARRLIQHCETKQLPQLDAELAEVVRTAPPQCLLVLPFVAAEAGRRSLTRREEQVLELVRRGRSNRQIAGELTLSIRTVEGHIASILAKYALARRSQLLSAAPGATADSGVTT